MTLDAIESESEYNNLRVYLFNNGKSPKLCIALTRLTVLVYLFCDVQDIGVNRFGYQVAIYLWPVIMSGCQRALKWTIINGLPVNLQVIETIVVYEQTLPSFGLRQVVPNSIISYVRVQLSQVADLMADAFTLLTKLIE